MFLLILLKLNFVLHLKNNDRFEGLKSIWLGKIQNIIYRSSNYLFSCWNSLLFCTIFVQFGFTNFFPMFIFSQYKWISPLTYFSTSEFVLVKLFDILIAFVNAFEQTHFVSFFSWSYNFCRILKHHFNQFLRHRSWVFHARRHIDFNQPRIQVLVNHKIIPNKFTISLSSHNETLTTLDGPNNYVFHFLDDFVPTLLSYKVDELRLFPHAFVHDKVFVVLLNRVVSQMLEPVTDVIKRVVIGTEPDVTLVIEPYFGWIVILNADPLPDVELFTSDQEWVFDIFLNDELTSSPATVCDNIIQVVVAANSSASWQNLVRLINYN